jgi:hypothetical protein
LMIAVLLVSIGELVVWGRELVAGEGGGGLERDQRRSV